MFPSDADSVTPRHAGRIVLLLMVFCAFALSASAILADSDGSDAYVKIGDLRYDLYPRDRTATVVGFNENPEIVEVPATVTYEETEYTVRSISDYAFRDCTSLRSVTVSEGIRLIGTSAFQGCSGLVNVTLPGSVNSIGEYAFQSCSSIKALNIPSGVTAIGTSAFYGCKQLEFIVIPDTVTTIGTSLFRGCESLFYAVLGNGITSIEKAAFQGCGKLLYIEIPDSVTSVGDSAFQDCISLVTVVFGKNIDTIGESAFWGCTSLASADIPDSVTSIGEAAFCGCSSMTSLTLSEQLTSVGKNVFLNCESLISVVIPEDVTVIERSAFQGCSSLVSVTFGNKLTSISVHAFSGCISLMMLDVPDTVTKIRQSQFFNCTSLQAMTLPASLEYVGDYQYDGITFYIDDEKIDTRVNPYKLLRDKTWTGIGDGNLYYYTGAQGYIVTFDGNGGTSEKGYMKTDTSGKLEYLPKATRTDYTFDGWFRLPEGGEQISTGTEFTDDTTVFAHWTQLPTYIVVFDGNKGFPTTQTRTTGGDGKIAFLPLAIRDPYTFDGWYTRTTTGDKITTDTVFTRNTTVYAHWIFNITFDGNGGIPEKQVLPTDADLKVPELPSVSRSGFSFDGWFTLPEGGEQITTGTVFTGNDTVYAHWTELPYDYTWILIITAASLTAAAVFAGIMAMRKGEEPFGP